MKITLLIGCLAVSVQAQTVDENAANATPTAGESTPYSVVERGPHHRVWERIVYETSPSGKAVPKVHRYTELATGMHYQKDGQWVETQESIEILPGGVGAAATNGPHQVYFPPDIYSGVIELVTPDGQHLRSRPLGISYFDGTNSVLIAELTNSIGQILPSGNQVIYPGAFTDFAADLVCTYRKGGFECDLVFQEQPPGPEQFGLNPSTSRLELLTEFFNTSEPVTEASAINAPDGLVDTTLKFGVMTMGPGKAFSVGNSGSSVRVYKSWAQLQGRTFLIEEVLYQRINSQLQMLPMPVNPTLSANTGNSVLRKVSATRLLPTIRLAYGITNAARLAKADLNQKPGVVLDYVALNGTTNNFTFQGDTTYFISGGFTINGTATFEGGTVIKYGNNDYNILLYGPAVCKTAPYRPVIITPENDNSVGETLPWSTGTPSKGYGSDGVLELFGNSYSLKYFRINFANMGVTVWDTVGYADMSDAQWVNCVYALDMYATSISLHNTLFSGCSYIAAPDTDSGAVTIRGEHVTVDRCNELVAGGDGYSSVYLTNSILTAVTNSDNATLQNSIQLTNGVGVYQPAGGGNYYLVNSSTNRNKGTTNISSALLTEIRQKTTYAPFVYSNQTITTNLTLGLLALRDTDAAPDLGYHYDPIDYVTHLLVVTNATVTVTNGAAIACYNTNGVVLQDGSAIVSVGTPLSPNRFIRYSSVQEQPVSFVGNPSDGTSVKPYHYGAVGPNGTFRFTQFACPANGGTHFYHSSAYSYGNLLVQDCELWNGGWTLDGPNSGSATATLKNNLFYRSSGSAVGQNSQTSLSFSNNLFWGANVTLSNTSSTSWRAYNNAFDSCNISTNSLMFTNGYNAYLHCTSRLNPTNAYDVVLTNTLAYQSGLLGDFYQPASSPLIDHGSTTADLTGLYYYTTRTNQVKETNSVVDIGYHYVALNANGNSIDTDGDGVPDYLEDANGNGIVDPGETDPNDYYNGVLPNLSIVSGNNQTGSFNAFFSLPLTVLVTNSYGAGLTNAPLTFSVTQGQAQVAISTNGPLTSSLVSRTGGDGQAAVWLYLPDNAPETNQVTVLATSGTNTVQVTFTCNANQVATPTFSPDGGSFAVRQNVTLGCATVGATIHYTFNGNDPTESDIAVTNGQAIVVTRTMTGKAKAFKTGLTPSQVETASFTLTGAIAAGRKHTLGLKSDGTVLAGGSNGNGQCGNGTTNLCTNLVSVLNLSNVVGIAAGQLFSLAWKSDGTAWAWGGNDSGQLGNGTNSHEQTTPTQVTGLTNIISMVAGGRHFSLALDSSGKVWAWGANDFGQLGDGTFSLRLTPVPVTNLNSVMAIAAGGKHSLALKSNGTVWAWGEGGNGRLGDGTDAQWSVPVQVTSLDSVMAISGGNAHSLALKTNGTVWAWGNNDWGQMGNTGADSHSQMTPVQVQGQLTNGNVMAIAAGGAHNLALRNDGTVWAWGKNDVGQLGDCTTRNRTIPVQVSGLSNVVAIAASHGHSVALKSDGTLAIWGYINYGQEVYFSSCPVTPEPGVLLANWDDTDGNGLPDWWELQYFGHLGVDPNADPDGDGLTNLQEYLLGTNPIVDDSAQSGSRLNYSYDLSGWLYLISGVQGGSVGLDNEGNVQTVSQ